MSKSNIFYKRLSNAVLQSGKSMNSVERELGYSRNSLSNYKNGTEPSATRLIELSQYFNLSPSYLIGKEDENILVNPNLYFKSLKDEQKLEILKLSQDWIYIEITNFLKHRV